MEGHGAVEEDARTVLVYRGRQLRVDSPACRFSAEFHFFDGTVEMA
jgi:hypothetical protein